MTETPSTVKTAAGSIYRKSDIAKVKVAVPDKEKSNNRRSPTGEEPKNKQQRQSKRQANEQDEAEISQSDEELLLEQQSIVPADAKLKFQDSPSVVTSKDILQGGGLNLAVRRAKPYLAGPFATKPKAKVVKDAQQSTFQNKNAATAAEVPEPQAEDQACSSNTRDIPNSTSNTHCNTRNKKEISRNTSPETILDTFNSKDLSANDWNRLAD